MKIKKFDSINVVPFIDVLLVLLVIVLVSTTFVIKGIIPIDLSTSNTSSNYNIKKDDLIITIFKNGNIHFNKIKINQNLIATELLKYNKNTIISINCDKNTKFDYFVNVLDILKINNYNNIGIITKNE